MGFERCCVAISRIGYGYCGVPLNHFASELSLHGEAWLPTRVEPALHRPAIRCRGTGTTGFRSGRADRLAVGHPEMGPSAVERSSLSKSPCPAKQDCGRYLLLFSLKPEIPESRERQNRPVLKGMTDEYAPQVSVFLRRMGSGGGARVGQRRGRILRVDPIADPEAIDFVPRSRACANRT